MKLINTSQKFFSSLVEWSRALSPEIEVGKKKTFRSIANRANESRSMEEDESGQEEISILTMTKINYSQ
jgi:hypothetical protein